MKTGAVFILYDHPLFARGLEGLLRKMGGVEVVGVAAKGEEAIAQITMLKPDAVLVEAGKGGPEPGTLLSRLLQEQHQARVVRVSLEDGTATLYAGRRWTANVVEELVKGIFDPMVLGL